MIVWIGRDRYNKNMNKKIALLLSKIIISLIVLVSPLLAYGQGRVLYENFDTTIGQPTDCVAVTVGRDGTPARSGRSLECNWDGTRSWQDSLATQEMEAFAPANNEKLFSGWFRVDRNVDHVGGSKLMRIGWNTPSEMIISCQFEQGDGATLFASVNNQSSFWGNAQSICGDHQWHRIRVYTSPTTIRLWLDNTLLREWTGTFNFGSGQHGVFFMSNWSSNPGWEHDANNNVMWDDIEVFSDTGTGGTGSMREGTMTQGGTTPTPTPTPSTDTAAPTVSISAPQNNSTVSGSTVTISANASDNVGVVGVQFRINGTNLGSEDVTAPYSTTWNTTSLSNSAQNITAVARDAAGNATISSVVVVTVNNTVTPTPAPAPAVVQSNTPIAHWNFDSTSGNIALDSSTNSNNGTLVNGPVWSAGRIGGGLFFDGINDYVNIGNPQSLIPSNQITMSAWVNLSNNVETRMIISKDDDVNPSTYLRTQGSAARCQVGGTRVGDFGNIPTNTWVHLACTYNGSNVILYVNGVQVGSVSKTGSIFNNPSNWNIGSRLNGGAMLMMGIIDDVRMYNRALSVSEIQGLLVTPTPAPTPSPTPTPVPTVSPTTTTPTIDITRPTISITAPTPMTTTYGMPIIITAEATDNVGVVGVQFQLNGVNLGVEDMTAPYAIIWDTKTTSIDDHNITAIARDAAGNRTTSDRVNVVVNDVAPVINTPPTPITTSTPPTTEPSTPTTPVQENDEPEVIGLKVGDRIRTTAWINVRSTAGGRYVGSQRTGRTGTITAGPGYANGLTWWKVNFTSGADGWVAEKFITKATVAMTDDDYRKNIANIYLLIKYLQDRIAGQTN